MADPKESKKVEIKLPENVQVDFNFERMLKNFTRQVQKSGILELVKNRRYYTKPSALLREELKKKRRKRNG